MGAEDRTGPKTQAKPLVQEHNEDENHVLKPLKHRNGRKICLQLIKAQLKSRFPQLEKYRREIRTRCLGEI